MTPLIDCVFAGENPAPPGRVKKIKSAMSEYLNAPFFVCKLQLHVMLWSACAATSVLVRAKRSFLDGVEVDVRGVIHCKKNEFSAFPRQRVLTSLLFEVDCSNIVSAVGCNLMLNSPNCQLLLSEFL
jgi:hypothetical protein